ncbi:MAG: LuxR C-terminal-related transcriptional regulator [Pseudomonadota bacterium]
MPEVRSGIVSRTGLVNRLRAEHAARIATVVAPGGYGKTTLLAQWAARDERPCAWITVDERDNEPLILLRHLATAFDRIAGLDASVLDALSGPAASVWVDAAPRLASAIASCPTPFLAILDGADALRRGDAADAVAALADHVPEGSILVLSGRVAPPLPIARLRAAGVLLELGTAELALTRREGALLLRAAGLELDDDVADELVARCEGWPTGLALATRALEDADAPADLAAWGGDDRFLADYYWAEHLTRLTPERLAFLRRTSVLDRLSGELCDAVLRTEDSASELTAIERDGLFLVPLDRHGDWFRYHGLFRDVLRHELEQHEPALAPKLHRRAADWLEAKGDRASALGHAVETGDADRAARILTTIALPGSGAPVETVAAWLARFEARIPLDAYPAVAALAAWVHALLGRPREAERCAAAAGRGTRGTARRSTSAGPWLAIARAALCSDGAERMAEDAERALTALPPESPSRATALALRGVAHALLDAPGEAEAAFAAAVADAEAHGDAVAAVLATAERALLVADTADPAAAEAIALEARERADDAEVAGALARAVAARALLRHGRWEDARAELDAAERLAERLTEALPWLAVQTRAELGAACIALRDRARADAQLAECERILALRDGLGSLAVRVATLRRAVDELPGAQNGHDSGLTSAELRLLPLLATHLSFREIGERLYVSRNTIKTQAISAYRKLGVSSRSAAIDRAAELGLLDAGNPAAGLHP